MEQDSAVAHAQLRVEDQATAREVRAEHQAVATRHPVGAVAARMDRPVAVVAAALAADIRARAVQAGVLRVEAVLPEALAADITKKKKLVGAGRRHRYAHILQFRARTAFFFGARVALHHLPQFPNP